MLKITNTSLPVIPQGVIDCVFNSSTSSNILRLKPISSTEPEGNPKIPSKDLKRKPIDCFNQSAVKKPFLLSPSSSSLENNITNSSVFQKNLIKNINRIHEKASALSFEKMQIYCAEKLNIDLQEVKNIYLAVSTHCPTTNAPSVIETKIPSPANRIIIDPKLKKKIADSIDQAFSKIKASHLEKIQIYCAEKLNIDLQEVKNIYFFLSPHGPATKSKLKPLNLELKKSSTDTILIFSPAAKKNLADNIDYLFRTENVSLEKIQTSYANQFKIALQDVKNICLAISTNCPGVNKVSEVKQIASFKDLM